MRLTSKGRYAVRAMLDLVMHSKGEPVRLQEISTRQKISLYYLEQLFRKLRKGSVVKSIRGPGGGYILGKESSEISVKNILDSVGENIDPAKNIPSNKLLEDITPEFNLTRDYFENLGTLMREYLATTSLGDIVKSVKVEQQQAPIVEAPTKDFSSFIEQTV